MNPPLTLASPKLEFDVRRYTATAVLNPAIVLLDVGSHLDILLAKDCEEIGKNLFVLSAARRVFLPHGWRHRAAEFAARFVPVRIREEELFNEVTVECMDDSYGVVAHPAEKLLVPMRRAPFAIRRLMGSEYQSLSRMRGREMRRQVMRMFAYYPGVQPMRSYVKPLRILQRFIAPQLT